VGGVREGAGQASNTLDRRGGLGGSAKEQGLGMARTDFDTKITSKISVGWKKASNVGATTKLVIFQPSGIPYSLSLEKNLRIVLTFEMS